MSILVLKKVRVASSFFSSNSPTALLCTEGLMSYLCCLSGSY